MKQPVSARSALARILPAAALALAALPLAAAPPAVAPVAAPAQAAPADAVKPVTGPGAEVIMLPLAPVVDAAQRVCATKTASGLGFSPLKLGTGPKPGATDYVLVNYIGYLEKDGAVFDQGVRQTFQSDEVIPGFAEGLHMMNRGGVWRFCIPAALGYGERATGQIPPNSNLVFQVELADFKSLAEVEAIRADQAHQAEIAAALAGKDPKAAAETKDAKPKK
ncbi:MAG: FKBP-type peptidyl-prolyl cis-trans isomerase [Novosphingobium sp.]